MKSVTEEELVELGLLIREIIPGAIWITDGEGNLLIQTNLVLA